MIAWLVMIFVFPCIVYYGTNKFGTKFYIYFVLICSILLFLVAVISNELLAYVPKDEIVKNDTELEDGIRNISRKTSIPADKIYFVEGEEKQTKFISEKKMLIVVYIENFKDINYKFIVVKARVQFGAFFGN